MGSEIHKPSYDCLSCMQTVVFMKKIANSTLIYIYVIQFKVELVKF